MSNLSDSIIEYIEMNRVSSTEVADALGKSGAIDGVSAINSGHFQVGAVHWVCAYGETNWHVHEQIQNVKPNSVVVIDVFECNNRAIIGDIMSKYLLLYRKCKAIVVIGNMRDVHRVVKENWPVWSVGSNPVGCFNIEKPLPDLEEIRQSKAFFENSIAVCDDTGVVIIKENQQSDDFFKKLKFIEEQEDIWYDCIDRLKWNTFETICLKNYLND